MMPTYSAWFGVAVIVILLLILIGGVAVIAAVGELTSRLAGREVGCLVGGLAALGWVWLIVQVENAGLAIYSFVLIGIPVVLVAVSRLTRPGARRRPSDA